MVEFAEDCAEEPVVEQVQVGGEWYAENGEEQVRDGQIEYVTVGEIVELFEQQSV